MSYSIYSRNPKLSGTVKDFGLIFGLCISIYISAIFLINSITPGYTDSPAFKQQSIDDGELDWVNMTSRHEINKEFKVPDITFVDYYSDGKSLNSTLWLTKPFVTKPISFREVDYGMLIDSDFDSKTGFGGIDYKVEINWKSTTKTWTKTVEQWGQYDSNRRVIKTYPNYTNFYQTGQSYVLLSVDMDQLVNPNKYKVIFYADSRKPNGDLIIDYTNWVAVPPLQLVIFTRPSSIDLTQGQQKTVEIMVNATEGYTPILNLSAKTENDEIIPIFTFRNLSVPSYGIAGGLLNIFASKNSQVGPTTLLILANSKFPSEELLNISGKQVNPYNVFSKSSIELSVHEPPDWAQQISDFWSKIGDFTNFVYGIIAGLTPFLYMLLRKQFSKLSNPPSEHG